MDHIGSLLLGLGNGGVYAALALALVLTYRSSGVINFATGALASTPPTSMPRCAIRATS